MATGQELPLFQVHNDRSGISPRSRRYNYCVLRRRSANKMAAPTRRIVVNQRFKYVQIVHPYLQGRGLRKKALRSVLDHTNDEPIILECTKKDNVVVYERLGFKVVEEVKLVQDGAGVKLWFMLRQGQQKQTD
ncbi:hypothetical protein KXW23_000938 [Aspergillus fumigatus]|nr:hypothetical protein KXW23_000938 [Aspergillus fumigatus]